MNSNKECLHKNKEILKSFRPNKRFGKFQAHYPPKKLTQICKDCGKKLFKWKPK